MKNISLSDIAAVTRGNDDGDGWGGNGELWETMSLRRFTPL